MTTLAAVLGAGDLPLAELQSARLDGELFAIDEAFLPIDQPETCTSRALALVIALSDYRGLTARLVAEQRTAAWVWSGGGAPPNPHQFSAAESMRSPVGGSRFARIREVTVQKSDLAVVSGLRLTTPVRTVLDLARCSPVFGRTEQALVRHLLDSTGLTPSDCLADLDARRKLPLKNLGLQRLALLPERLF